MGSTGAARGMAGNMPVRDTDYFRPDEETRTLTPEAARTISEAIWGEDAVGAVLDNLSDALDGYDYLGDGFDVSYQGGITALRAEIRDVFKAAGVDIKTVSKNVLEYDNDGMTVRIKINSDPTASTYTMRSKGYYITVENIE